MSAAEYYEVLGLQPGATAEEIRSAYRRMVRQVHPDAGGTAALFRIVQVAYDCLSDPASRDRYDRQQPASAKPRPDEPTVDLPESWKATLWFFVAGRVDALHLWDYIDAIAQGEPMPELGVPLRPFSDFHSPEEAQFVQGQATEVLEALRLFRLGRVSGDDLAAEAMEILGLGG